MRRSLRSVLVVALPMAAAFGCQSPYYADKGALIGGLGGAGAGALIGSATGHMAEGAIIGTGLGLIGGSLVGNSLDEIEAKNRAQIEAQIGRQVAAGAVTIDDVITMTKAGVDESLIVNHINAHGSAKQLQPADLIFLQQQGVSPRVVAALQSTPQRTVVQTSAVQPVTRPVIVEEHYYGGPSWCGPWWGPPHRRYHHHPHSGVGISFSQSWH